MTSGQGIVPGQEIYTLLKSDIALISQEEFNTVSTIFLIGIPVIILTFGMILISVGGGMHFHNSGYTGN